MCGALGWKWWDLVHDRKGPSWAGLRRMDGGLRVRAGAFLAAVAAVHLEGGSVEPMWWQQVLRVSPCVRAEGGGERAVWWNSKMVPRFGH